MNNKNLWAIGVIAALFFGGSLMRSPQSQITGATYSTPVTVLNTTANPASVLDADKATRVAYQSTKNSNCNSGQCTVNFSPIPLGFRLVVEYISGNLTVTSSSGLPVVQFTASEFFGGAVPWSINIPTSAAAPGSLAFAQPLRSYVDPGTPNVTMFLNSGNVGGFTATLVGYLQNCGVVPCIPQQN